ncbi:amino acid transporter [Okibacterium sp. HSC-33S16]|uniref:APC family permease n=1 Tax=Okibacterium sp. HSC-33S16 TaxID=2910965 RepID=UPI0020A04F43|nr:APC family permease [Okibacterium sp. HSC-33S16]MCP2031155.1 amino acid transporter [Okibacterium sp. HSC-33S16]
MEPTLNRRLGVPGIVFMVIAAAAPITVVAANFPLILTVSGSIGAPLMVLVATVILLLFSVGYAWMTPRVPDAGAFYSYVSRGLGRRAGLGTASIALLCYVLLTVSMTAYLGVQAGNLIELWTGLELPWWLISGVMLVIVGLLGFRSIDLSAKVLGVVLVLEVVAVIAIDLGVLFSGRELTATPFSPAEALSGTPGLGLLFAFLGFFGFEATAVFRNEARNPEKTVPRATYIAVISVGVLYFVSSWLVIAGLGGKDAIAAASANPDSVVVGLAGEVIAPIVGDIVQVLVVTSMFACMLAFHNIVTRYLFTLGQRGVLPQKLADVHPKHRAPSRASLWVSGITSVVIVVSALAQLDPVVQIYTWYSGAGAVGVIVMMALTSFAVLAFGAKHRGPSGDAPSRWVTVASVLGGIGLLGVLALSVWNFPFLVGGTVAAIIWGVVLLGVFVAGTFLPQRDVRLTRAEPVLEDAAS